jgi:hypothetical protein
MRSQRLFDHQVDVFAGRALLESFLLGVHFSEFTL